MLTPEELSKLSGAESLFPSPRATNPCRRPRAGSGRAFQARVNELPADGPVKRAILGEYNARLCGYSPVQLAYGYINKE